MERPRLSTFKNICFDTPLLPVALLLSLGILIGDWTYPLFYDYLLPLTGSAFVLLIIIAWKRRLALGISIVIVLLGILRISLNRYGEIVEWKPQKTAYMGIITGTVKEKEKCWITDVKIEKSKVKVTLLKNQMRPTIGDKILIYGVIEPLHNDGNPGNFDYATFLRRQGYKGECFCYASNWEIQKGTAQLNFLQKKRLQLIEKVKAAIHGNDFAIISAMTLGEKSYLSKETKTLFSETGSSHILALSGLHLGIIFFCAFYCIRKARKTILKIGLCAITIIALWCFVLLVNCPVSLLRAGLMATIGLSASCMRRNVKTMDCLMLAVVILLICSPQSLFDVGFQLSVVSVFSIILTMPIIPKFELIEKFWLTKYIYRLIATSFCAQLGTLPIIAYTFNVVPLYGVLTSIIVIPITTILLCLALLLFTLPFLKAILAYTIHILIQCMLSALEGINNLPYSHINMYPSVIMIICTYIMLLCAYSFIIIHAAKTIYIFSLALSSFFASWLINVRQHELSPRIIIYNIYKMPNIHFITNNHDSKIWVNENAQDKGLQYIQQTFWNEYGLQPQIIRLNFEQNDSIKIFQFRNKQIAILQRRLPQTDQHPLRIDYLYVCRGFKQQLNDALTIYNPKLIIIDKSVTDFYRLRLIHEARQNGIEIYDIAKQGAFIVKF